MTDARSITQQRCFHHWQREAVAKCPECKRFFCRECITEHEDRVICANCLAKLVSHRASKSTGLRPVVRVIQCAASFLILWLFFYFAGQLLLKIPVSFHEGTIWNSE